jgi:hypothetical protein
MKRSITLFILSAILWSLSCVSEPVKEEDLPRGAHAPTAAVGDAGVAFWFPVANIGRAWPRNVWHGSIMEYSWVVRVTLQKTAYEFGYTYFTDPRQGRRTGSFRDLLAHGDHGVWKLTPDKKSGIGLPESKWVAVSEARGGLLIQVTSPEFLEAFLAERPASVLFIERGLQWTARQRQTEVTLRYTEPRALESHAPEEPSRSIR